MKFCNINHLHRGRLSISILLVFLVSIFFVAQQVAANGLLVDDFGTDGAVEGDGVALTDLRDDMAIDDAGDVYLVGYDSSLGSPNFQGRIEKIDSTTGAQEWVKTVNPSANGDAFNSVASYGGYVYIAGYDSFLGSTDSQWRIEKRDVDGALVSGFGVDGVLQYNPSLLGHDQARHIVADATGIYILGNVNGSELVRLEKRRLDTGGLLWLQIINLDGDDSTQALAVDSTGVYVGVKRSITTDIEQPSIYKTRTDFWSYIRKYNLASPGALVDTFGDHGIVAIADPSTGSNDISEIIPDGTSLYVTGRNKVWPLTWTGILKRLNSADGSQFWNQSLLTGFLDIGIATDSTNLYLARGYVDLNSDNFWRLEKRNLLGDITTDSSFGESGTILDAVGSGSLPNTQKVLLRNGSLYVLWSYMNADYHTVWRLEKRNSVPPSLLGNVVVSSNIQEASWNLRGPNLLNDVKKTAVAGNQLYALKNDGTVWHFYSRTGTTPADDLLNEQIGMPAGMPEIIDIVGGQNSSSLFFLVENGDVWGMGDYPGDGTAWSGVPVRVKGEGGTGYLTNVSKITAYATTNYALAGGRVYSWGKDNQGQLGNDAALTDSLVPVVVSGLTTGVTDIAARSNGGYALKSGTVWGWGGANFLNELYGAPPAGGFITTPIEITALRTAGIQKIFAGTNVFFGLDGTGAVWSMGKNDVGQLGQGTTWTAGAYAPAKIQNFSNVDAIVAGLGHTIYAHKTDNTVWAWGFNGSAEGAYLFGDGTLGNSSTPRQTSIDAIKSISASGSMAAYGVKANGTVWAWGENDGQKLFDNTTNQAQVPVRVIGGYRILSDGGMEKPYSDMPPGSYAINWADVLGYTKPASSTQTLSEKGAVTFSGDYLAPDLQASSVTLAGTVVKDSPIDFSVSITNASESPVTKEFHNIFQIEDPEGSIETLDSPGVIDELRENASQDITYEWTPALVGRYQVRACADSSVASRDGVILEFDEGNNCSADWKEIDVLSPCSPDESWSISTNECVGSCAVGYAWDSNLGQCAPNACLECPAGYGWTGTACAPFSCPAGQHWNTIAEKCEVNMCKECPDGEGAVGNACVPTECPEGEIWLGGVCQTIGCSTPDSSDWGAWGDCSASCSGVTGIQKRSGEKTRTCTTTGQSEEASCEITCSPCKKDGVCSAGETLLNCPTDCKPKVEHF